MMVDSYAKEESLTLLGLLLHEGVWDASSCTSLFFFPALP